MRILLDLDGTVLESWTPEDFSPRPTVRLGQILALGKAEAICSNQGGIAWLLAGGRPGRKYPSWPEVMARVEAGMALTGVRLAFIALHHPSASASIPRNSNLLWTRGKEIGLPPILIRLVHTGMGAVIKVSSGFVLASWAPGWRKPEPGMLLTARRLLGPRSRERWMYVGDEESDHRAANAAGMEFFSVGNFSR